MEIRDPSHWVYKENKYDSAKHESERAKNGFSFCDWINFNDYLAWVIIQGLVKFRDEGSGFPAEFPTDSSESVSGEEQWKSILNDMIDGFEAHFTLEESSPRDYASYDDYLEACRRQREVRDRGLDLFRQYFGNLWD